MDKRMMELPGGCRLVLKSSLDTDEYKSAEDLRKLCEAIDGIQLKLELPYKYDYHAPAAEHLEFGYVNEFLVYNAEGLLVGYAGICGFGGPGGALEIAGMVHPDFRRLGIFTRINDAVRTECMRRESRTNLLLCDRNARTGQEFLTRRGAVLHSSEYGMLLEELPNPLAAEKSSSLCLRKATDGDAGEILRQNRIYFRPDEDPPAQIPSEEEARGMTIYIAEENGKPVGKVHLQEGPAGGGIYGLGVLPEHRGRGFGRQILLSGVRILADKGQLPVELQVAVENSTALGLYQSCGFHVVSVMDYFTGGEGDLLP